jgi:hypothetical protein
VITLQDSGAYAYLLGLYLGDGYLWQPSKNSWRLGIYCDAAYPEIIAAADSAIAACAPGCPIRHNAKKAGSSVVVLCSCPTWGDAFPQHGPGRKHERKIELEPWQRAITREHPRPFLRGLIHSDGCRCMNEFDTILPSGRVAHYAYPRYFFSNLSVDIRKLFCEHCDLLEIKWSQSNARNISVSSRKSVALLDSFVGPKT